MIHNYTFNDLFEGQSYSEKKKFTFELLNEFINISGDSAPVHTDSNHAREMGFDKCILHGFLTNIYFSRILGMFLPGPNTIIHSLKIDMIKPSFVDDNLEHSVSVKKLFSSIQSVQLDLIVTNQFGELVNRGSAICVFKK